MSNNVYANGREVSCKSGSGKTPCAFPDVCFTPPENPATPPGVPVPYPNTGIDSDTTDGSKTVKITGKEVMLKNKSYFKKSYGDEAGCAAKKGVVTSVHRGKVYFIAWSMNVKIEGENVVRHFDMTTHNHASPTTNTPPWKFIDSQDEPPKDHPCHEEIKRMQKACKGSTRFNKGGRKHRQCPPGCKEKMACILVPKEKDKEMCCSPTNTGHHMIEDHWVKGKAVFNRAGGIVQSGAGSTGYKQAPTVCANRFRTKGSVHRRLHDIQGTHEESHMPGGSREGEKWNYGAAKNAAVDAHSQVFPDAECDPNCIKSQLDAFYGDDNNRLLNKPTKQALGKRRGKIKEKLPRPKKFSRRK